MAVELEDLITIRTPEGVELRLALAGLGSRFIAGTADLALQAVLTLILVLLTGALGRANGFLEAIFFVGLFVIWLLYPILFEVLAGGRTPGKRWTHLRVVLDDGAPVDLPASAIRNLMRLLDGPPLSYLPTLIGIAVTAHNQRPGDLAAGTLVIRERASAGASSPGLGADVPGARAWDVSAVTTEELAVVRRFLERRDSLDRAARRQLALRLSQGLRSKVGGAPADLDAERFLEELASIKASRW
ncbi:MAG TPA: RDD family protein [Solirubrobacteraceae bacterium]|jgi:uncharacterized RDD family membrane protein YckC|nr:RDD family protein [Solirubrobacteraceae bacterium]